MWKKNVIFSKDDNTTSTPYCQLQEKEVKPLPLLTVPMIFVYNAVKSTASVWIIPCTAQNEILVYDVHKLIFK